MKRIISLLLTLFVSAFNGVKFTNIGDVPFKQDEYYTIDVADAPDYRDIYGSTPVGGSDISCTKTFVKASSPTKVKCSATENSLGVWFLDGVSVSLSDDIMNQNTFTVPGTETNIPIVAPYNGHIVTKFKGNNGKHMDIELEVDGSKYLVSFEDMERWYCCRRKTHLYDDIDTYGNGIWHHTLEDGASLVQFSQGYILGYAIGGKTTISMSEASNGFKSLYDHR